MRLSDIIMYGLTVAIIIILGRIIFSAPVIQHAMENFASGNGGGRTLVNSSTACPAGTKFFMYGGQAYCCSGRVNPDADTVVGSCRPVDPSGKLTFCSLGPATEKVKNCQEVRVAANKARGAEVCPPSMPNYAETGGKGLCCTSAVNASLDDCVEPSAGTCSVSGQRNPYMAGADSCEFQRARESDDQCPTGYGALTVEGQGAFKGLTLYGCTNSGQICYSQAVVSRLRELGYDTSGLKVCGR